ncbi:hypothetical protein MHYP_G00033510 [Metynnis hypsauchen]
MAFPSPRLGPFGGSEDKRKIQEKRRSVATSQRCVELHDIRAAASGHQSKRMALGQRGRDADGPLRIERGSASTLTVFRGLSARPARSPLELLPPLYLTRCECVRILASSLNSDIRRVLQRCSHVEVTARRPGGLSSSEGSCRLSSQLLEYLSADEFLLSVTSAQRAHS